MLIWKKRQIVTVCALKKKKKKHVRLGKIILAFFSYTIGSMKALGDVEVRVFVKDVLTSTELFTEFPKKAVIN